MHVVIEIDENIYKRFMNNDNKERHQLTEKERFELSADAVRLTRAFCNGTPLPKGHGALKDFEKLYADMSEREELARQRVIDTPSNNPCYMRYVAQLNERTSFKEMLYDAPTIIEADKVESAEEGQAIKEELQWFDIA